MRCPPRAATQDAQRSKRDVSQQLWGPMLGTCALGQHASKRAQILFGYTAIPFQSRLDMIPELCPTATYLESLGPSRALGQLGQDSRKGPLRSIALHCTPWACEMTWKGADILSHAFSYAWFWQICLLSSRNKVGSRVEQCKCRQNRHCWILPFTPLSCPLQVYPMHSHKG